MIRLRHLLTESKILDVKSKFVNKELLRQRQKAADELQRIDDVTQNIDSELVKFEKLVNKISTKHNITYDIDEPHGPGKFCIKFNSTENDKLYTDLKKLVDIMKSKFKAMHIVVSGGHGYTGQPIEYFDHGPYYVAWIG